jgi:sterol desaturase/sphingolipid hydroxylase (fatty acid hydroxylase superfamily)
MGVTIADQVLGGATASSTPAATSRRVVPGRFATGRVYLPGVLVAVVTLVVAGVAVDRLARQRGLGPALAAGRAELLAPAIGLLVLAAMLAERRWPADGRAGWTRGVVQDAWWTVVHVLAVVPLMTLMGVGFAVAIGDHVRWLDGSWSAAWPAWLLVPLTLAAMDAANWLAHLADHRIAPLWRLHAVHHSQEELTVLTSFRAHPLMHTTGFFVATAAALGMMGDRPLAPVLITGYVCLGTLPHANVGWTFGPLGKVVVSPAYHRRHHSAEGEHDVNLGVVLTVWDVLAGRARFPVSGAVPCRTGLAGRPVSVEQPGQRPLRVLGRQLTEPFLS